MKTLNEPVSALEKENQRLFQENYDLRNENHALRGKDALRSASVCFLACLSLVAIGSCHKHKRQIRNLLAPQGSVVSSEIGMVDVEEEKTCCEKLGINHKVLSEMKNRFQK